MMNTMRFSRAAALLALAISLPASACMTFVVGKKASTTGYVIVGHNEDDWPPLETHHGILSARDWPAGTYLPATKGCNPHIPQAAHTLACYWGEVKFPYGDGNADTFLNEKGVIIVSDAGGETTERMDDPTLLTEGGVKFNLRRAVGERATNAREGVRILCEMVERYGYAPAARIYTIADRDEAWLVQVVHGKNYAARRCPDDEVTIMPNLYTIYELEDCKPDTIRLSPNLIANARAKGFWDGRGRFNFARAYQGSYATKDYPENVAQTFEHPNNTGRFRQAIRLLTGEEWPEKKPFPFSVRSRKPQLSPDDLRAILTAHNAPLTNGKHVLQSWSICSSTTIESEICVFGATPRETEMRVALGRGCEAPYRAFKPFDGGLPRELDESASAPARLNRHVRPMDLAYATPESQGVSSRGILQWLDACERTFDGGRLGRMHGFVLLRHGKVIAEGSWKPFDTLNEPHMLYSHSKSFTATAVGFAIDDGLIDLDERVIGIFTNERPAMISQNLAELRVRDLLTMNAGKKDHLLRGDNNWATTFLAQDFTRMPGTHFRYDSDATYMLAAIVERRTGKKLMDYLQGKLFDKIGIAKAWSTTSPQGIACGGWGMNMTTREMARFGQFYLQGGEWNGESLLSTDWITLATTRQTWSGSIRVQGDVIGSGSDWSQGYGFQFWRCRPQGVYRADGASGQLTIVMPRQDAVLSIHAGLGDMQRELNLVWEYLLPAMKAQTIAEDVTTQAALDRRLRTLEIPPVLGNVSEEAPFWARKFELAKNPRGFTSIAFSRISTSEIRCQLGTRAGMQTFPVGIGHWRMGSLSIDTERQEWLGAYIGEHKTAASAGIDSKDVFHLRIYLTHDTGDITIAITPNGQLTGEFKAMAGCAIKSADQKTPHANAAASLP